MMNAASTTFPAHGRYDILDGMRGVTALCVMLYHFTMHADSALFGSASIAVDFFFMLSGFVIAHSYSARLQNDLSAREYIARRLIRLFPMFLAGLILGTPVLAYLARHEMAHYAALNVIDGTLLNILFIPYLNAHEVHNAFGLGETAGAIFPANPSSWSLFFEMVASFAFLGLTKLSPRKLRLAMQAGFALFLLSGIILAFVHHRFECDMDQGWGSLNFLGGFPRVLFGFALGMMIYRFVTNEKNAALCLKIGMRFRSSFWLYLAVIAILAMPKPLRGFYSIAMLVSVIPFLVLVGGCLRCKNGSLEHKAAQYLGWLSYPVYCLHYPIFRGVVLLTQPYDLPQPIVILLATLATFVLAHVITKLYEEPVRALLTRKMASLPLSNGPQAA